MRKQLPLNDNHIIKTYSFHAYISSILLDNKLQEPYNVWFSNVRLSDNLLHSNWFEKEISIENDNNYSPPEVKSLFNMNQASCREGDISGGIGNDDFKYLYSQIERDGSIELEIEHIKNTSVWSKGGLMIRESLHADSRYIYIFCTPSVNGVIIQSRDTKGGSSNFEKICSSYFPLRLKIERSGEDVILYCGSEDSGWEFERKITFVFESNAYIGLALCSPEENAYLNWYFSNYIQLYCYKDFSMHGIPLDFNVGMHKDGDFYFHCPYLVAQNIRYSLLERLEKMKINIIEFIICFIDDDNYIDVELDEFYVPDRDAFETLHRAHSNLIFGYDRLNRTFDISGYTSGSIYKSGKITFEQFEKAYIRSFDTKISLLKPHSYYTFTFNIETVKQQLIGFLNSSDTLADLAINRNPQIDIVYGLDVYDYLIQNLLYARNDIRPLYLIYEHKKIMLMRLQYMNRHNIISSDLFDYIYPEYKALEKLALVARNLHLKNIATHSIKYMDKIIESLKIIKNKEKNLVSLLISSI